MDILFLTVPLFIVYPMLPNPVSHGVFILFYVS